MRLAITIGGALAAVIGILIALSRMNDSDDKGSVSQSWLNDEKGKRDQ
jgi:hypothetical protein